MPRKKLKVYVWEGVLTDWTSGLVVAYAYSAEEAIELLKNMDGCLLNRQFDGTKLDGVEPTVHEKPFAVYVYGGG